MQLEMEEQAHGNDVNKAFLLMCLLVKRTNKGENINRLLVLLRNCTYIKALH